MKKNDYNKVCAGYAFCMAVLLVIAIFCKYWSTAVFLMAALTMVLLVMFNSKKK